MYQTVVVQVLFLCVCYVFSSKTGVDKVHGETRPLESECVSIGMHTRMIFLLQFYGNLSAFYINGNLLSSDLKQHLQQHRAVLGTAWV